MEVIISNKQLNSIFIKDLKLIISNVLNKAGEFLEISKNVEVSVLITNDKYIKNINKKYRNENKATDVLSFALNESDEINIIGGSKKILLGDIVISLETAIRQANNYKHSLKRELSFLAIHGILHLLGYNHEDDIERKKMCYEEDRILKIMGITRDMD